MSLMMCAPALQLLACGQFLANECLKEVMNNLSGFCSMSDKGIRKSQACKFSMANFAYFECRFILLVRVPYGCLVFVKSVKYGKSDRINNILITGDKDCLQIILDYKIFVIMKSWGKM